MYVQVNVLVPLRPLKLPPITGPVGVKVLLQASVTSGGVGSVASAMQKMLEPSSGGNEKSGRVSVIVCIAVAKLPQLSVTVYVLVIIIAQSPVISSELDTVSSSSGVQLSDIASPRVSSSATVWTAGADDGSQDERVGEGSVPIIIGPTLAIDIVWVQEADLLHWSVTV